MTRPSVLIIFYASFLVSNAWIQPLHGEPKSDPIHPGWETYTHIRDTLQTSGAEIDYDTLMHTYRSMIQTQHKIPHMDRLLASLIDKRNQNPRIDQMILIFAARALGSSKYPVSDADGIFQAILVKDNRLSEWVLAFVAEAIGDYIVDMPEGGKLVDLLEKKLSMIVSSSNPKKENFGHHFLPPPKGQYIRSYIANIQSMTMRMSERRHYYLLISNGHAEADIEKAIRQKQTNGMTKKAKDPFPRMKHLVQNPDLMVQ